MTFALVLLAALVVAYGVWQWADYLPDLLKVDVKGPFGFPMPSHVSDYEYRKARWQELHHAGPKAYRHPHVLHVHHTVHPKYGPQRVKEWTDGTFSMEFRPHANHP